MVAELAWCIFKLDGTEELATPSGRDDNYGIALMGTDGKNMFPIGAASNDPLEIDFNNVDCSIAVEAEAAQANKQMCITELIISVAAEIDVQLLDTDDTVIMNWIYLNENGGFTKTWDPKTPLRNTDGKGLKVKASGAGGVTVHAEGYWKDTSS